MFGARHNFSWQLVRTVRPLTSPHGHIAAEMWLADNLPRLPRASIEFGH
jgi:hypothetical protein